MSRSPKTAMPIMLGAGIGVLSSFLLLVFLNLMSLNDGKKMSPFFWLVGLAIGATGGSMSGLVVSYLLAQDPKDSQLYNSGVEAIGQQMVEDGLVVATNQVEATRQQMGLHSVNWKQKTIDISPDLAQLINELPLPGEAVEEFVEEQLDEPLRSDFENPPGHGGSATVSTGTVSPVPETPAPVPVSAPAPAEEEPLLVLPDSFLADPSYGVYSNGAVDRHDPWRDS